MYDIKLDFIDELKLAKLQSRDPNILCNLRESIKNSLKNILLISKSEIPGFPEDGGGIGGLVFELFTPVLSMTLRNEIERLIRQYEPRVRLEDVVIKENPEYNSLLADIYYSFKENGYEYGTQKETIRLR